MKQTNLMIRIGRPLAVWLLLAGLACTAVGAVDLKGVPDDAVWFMQVEARELAALPLFQRLAAETRAGTGGALARLLALAQQASINTTSDIHRVTAVGVGPADQVMMIEGAWRAANLNAALSQQPGFRKLRERGLDLLSLAGARQDQPVYLLFFGARTLLIGDTPAALVSVAEALAKPGVGIGAFRTFSGMNTDGEGVLAVLLARDGESLMRLIPDAAMLLQTTAIAVRVRALPRERLGVDLTAQAADAQTAANLAQMLTGLQAMLAMRAASDPLWGAVSQSMRIRAEDKRIRIDFALDPDLAHTFLATVYRELRRKGRL